MVYSGCVICYLGVGAIAHALFLGPDIAWNYLSVVLLIGWPVVVFSWAALVGSIAGTFAFLVFLLTPAPLVSLVAPALLREWSRWVG
jgi:hypothetical protein